MQITRVFPELGQDEQLIEQVLIICSLLQLLHLRAVPRSSALKLCVRNIVCQTRLCVDTVVYLRLYQPVLEVPSQTTVIQDSVRWLPVLE